eukprot:Clim_evm2s221 gene=Clim_evmTU2s221
MFRVISHGRRGHGILIARGTIAQTRSIAVSCVRRDIKTDSDKQAATEELGGTTLKYNHQGTIPHYWRLKMHRKDEFHAHFFALANKLGLPLPESLKEGALDAVAMDGDIAAEVKATVMLYDALAARVPRQGRGQYHPTNSLTSQAGRLNVLGQAALEHSLAHHIFFRYPFLPAPMMQELVIYLNSPPMQYKLSQKVGLTPIVQHLLGAANPDDAAGRLAYEAECQKAMVAVVGALNLADPSSRLLHDFMVSTYFEELNDREALFSTAKYADAMATLRLLCDELGLVPPHSVIEKESGRHSRYPVYVVSVWSGDRELAKGAHTSVRGAELEACRTALYEHFSAEVDEIPVSAFHYYYDFMAFELDVLQTHEHQSERSRLASKIREAEQNMDPHEVVRRWNLHEQMIKQRRIQNTANARGRSLGRTGHMLRHYQGRDPSK